MRSGGRTVWNLPLNSNTLHPKLLKTQPCTSGAKPDPFFWVQPDFRLNFWIQTGRVGPQDPKTSPIRSSWPKKGFKFGFNPIMYPIWGVRKMHSWAKLSKVWQSWHVFKRGNKKAKLAKLVHIPIHFWIYYAKQSWQSWDINPLFKAKLAKLGYNFSDNGQSSNPRQS